MDGFQHIKMKILGGKDGNLLHYVGMYILTKMTLMVKTELVSQEEITILVFRVDEVAPILQDKTGDWFQ